MTEEFKTEKQWLAKYFRKSDSEYTVQSAKSSLSLLDMYCKYGNITRGQLIKRLQGFFHQQPSNIQGICNILDDFMSFLYQDHEELMINEFIAPQPFKKKSPKSIKTYFGFIRSYLILCHGVRVTVDDVKAYVTFPRIRKIPRKPITLKVLKKIIEHSDAKHRALFLTLISSGVRVGEALSLKKKNIFENETPVRIKLKAEITKTKEGRETYITSEAFEKLKPKT